MRRMRGEVLDDVFTLHCLANANSCLVISHQQLPTSCSGAVNSRILRLKKEDFLSPSELKFHVPRTSYPKRLIVDSGQRSVAMSLRCQML